MVKAIAVLGMLAGCLGDPTRPVADASGSIDAPAGSGDFVFGDNMVEDGNDQHMCGTPEGSSFKTGSTVSQVHSLRVYLSDYMGDDAVGLDAAIYDTGSNGEPTNLLVSGSKHGSAQLARDQWHQLPLATPFTPLPNHIYWIAVMCPQGFGTMFTIRFKWLGAGTGVGACDATTTGCTEHGRNAETTFDQVWANYVEFKPSMNSFYASQQ